MAKRPGRKPTPPGEIKWDIKRRLEYIEFHIYWIGPFHRYDLTESFKISAAQASKDIALYKKMIPENMLFNNSQKAYFKSDSFRPLFINTEPHSYLSHLMASKAGYFSVETSFPISFAPDCEVSPIPYRKIDQEVFRAIIKAVRNKSDIEIQYQSMKSPEPLWRWIAPHSFCYDGFRWHTRAFCHQSKTFKDFLLARMIDIGETKESSAKKDDDVDWHEIVTVRIGPNPDLPDGSKKIVEFDYDMVDGVKEIHVRKAMRLYFTRALRLDLNPDQFPPEEQQIICLNKE